MMKDKTADSGEQRTFMTELYMPTGLYNNALCYWF